MMAPKSKTWFAIVSAGLALFGSAHGAALTSLENALRERGVTDQSQASLMGHLQGRDKVVRALAANKLAADGHLDAVPAIESALSAEHDLKTQTELSQALWILRDPKGSQHLRAMCADSSMPLSVLTTAVQKLQMLHLPSGECAATLMASMRSKNEPSDQGIAACTLSTVYREVTPKQAKAIFILIQNLLSDGLQQPYVRLLAGDALAQIGSPEATELLKREILMESDPTMRSAFEIDVNQIAENR